MRRMLPILALLLVVSAALGAAPASPHAIVTPNEIPVGEPVTINFQVVADLPRPMVEIRFQAPAAFEVSSVGRVPGWEVDHSGGTITLKGNAVPGTFVVVPISGEASERSELRFPLVEVGDDGSTLEYTEGGFGGQAAPVVYAGLEFDDSGTAAGDGGAGNGVVPVVIGVAVFAVLAGGAIWFVRRGPAAAEVRAGSKRSKPRR